MRLRYVRLHRLNDPRPEIRILHELFLTGKEQISCLSNESNEITALNFFGLLPSPEELLKISSFPSLKAMSFDNGFRWWNDPFSAKHMSALLTNSNLDALLINYRTVELEGILALSKRGKLSCLRLRCCELNDEALQSLSRMDSLKALTIAYNPELTFEAILRFSRSANLTQLAVDESQIVSCDLIKEALHGGELEIW